MIKVKAIGKVTLEDAQKISSKYPGQKIIIVMENTKYQSAEILETIGNNYYNIMFSVYGGLSPKKNKFNCEHYQERTYYTGLELSKIIKIYSSIERGIDLSWTETQKAMYIYKQICNNMIYSECKHGSKDYSRGIGGLLYNKAVCAGFAMIYKEALDRIGIECHYQNKQQDHNWNIAKLDGEYRAIELTWETSNKTINGCEFKFFGTDPNFYKNKHHDIIKEKEETKYQIKPYTQEEIEKNKKEINEGRVMRLPLKEKRNHQQTETILINKVPCQIHVKQGIIELKTNSPKSLISKRLIRNDNTSLLLIKTKYMDETNINEYLILEPREKNIIIGKILSESRLEDLQEEYDYVIANGLLSEERITNKINNFNGYVGYIGKNKQIYYNQEFEEERLNIIR